MEKFRKNKIERVKYIQNSGERFQENIKQPTRYSSYECVRT